MSKQGYFGDIEELTLNNSNFREVLYTAKNSQLVVMSLKPGEDIGLEVHEDGDQFFRFEKGTGTAIINDSKYDISDGVSLVIPQGASHNIINTSETEDLKLYTIYSPPHHKDKTVHQTKEIAQSDDEHFDGQTSE